ncbi:S-adenosyl-l-methionine hydroxide adenosyltransferase family protein [Synechococcus sp. PCC 7336]|uniref:SAM hydrolase/SAM-dependent halogenase family protein n=1 Tax=Synechococcus sp. PCC 7336 TaxID=195250 RepID=UPI000346406B|nr:SAM-dependent chlorinase/fluorinase [Synechococcus sp. PCC 7336]
MKLIHLIADYGANDPAFAEVSQRLLSHLPAAQIRCLSVPPFSTLATGFWIAQLGLNPGPSDRLIYHNCAPRHDNPAARADNEGEGLTYAVLPNGVCVVGVWAGYTLSFIKDIAQSIHAVEVSRGGSQFRSRDVFPPAAAAIARGEKDLLGEAIAPERIPNLPSNRVVWVDGYGNLKTTIAADALQLSPMAKVTVRVGDVVSDAVFSDGSFDVPEGTLAFAPGSSGWSAGGKTVRWMELFLRGGNAWQRFGKPRLDREVSYQVQC